MGKAFPYARYNSGQEFINIHCEDLTEETYESTYNDKLYCPNKDCSEKILCVGLRDGSHRKPFFRCFRISDHREDCPFKTAHKQIIELNARDIPTYFSDGRIIQALERQMKEHFLGEFSAATPGNNHRVNSTPTRKNILFYPSFDIYNAIVRGVASVGGIVRKVELKYDDETNLHAYINLYGNEDVISVMLNSEMHRNFSDTRAFAKKTEQMWRETKPTDDMVCIGFGVTVFARNKNGVRIIPYNTKGILCAYIPKQR